MSGWRARVRMPMAFLVSSVLAISMAACGPKAPAGYTELGSIGHMKVYGAVEAAQDQYAIWMTDGHDVYCDDTASLNGLRVVPACSDYAGSTFTYAAAFNKGVPLPTMCSSVAGEAVPSTVLSTPRSWSFYIVAVVGRRDWGAVADCSALGD